MAKIALFLMVLVAGFIVSGCVSWGHEREYEWWEEKPGWFERERGFREREERGEERREERHEEHHEERHEGRR